jgi:tetratricopeptide (TPR) repeat protein
MKSIFIQCLIISLLFTVGYLTPVSAVTDAELEALEKQIEQQEVEAKRKTETEKRNKAAAEIKRKADQKRKLETEAIRKNEEELKLIAEEKAKLEAEKARLVEIERQRQEDAEKKKAEEAKRAQFTLFMTNADSALNNKKYTEALQNYTQALEIYPNDSVAQEGQSSAQELKYACTALVGEWDWSFDIKVTINADGNMTSRALIPNHGTWECTDPLNGKFTLHWVVGGWVENISMSADGNTLDIRNNIDFRYQAWRKGTKKLDPSREIPL